MLMKVVEMLKGDDAVRLGGQASRRTPGHSGDLI